MTSVVTLFNIYLNFILKGTEKFILQCETAQAFTDSECQPSPNGFFKFELENIEPEVLSKLQALRIRMDGSQIDPRTSLEDKLRRIIKNYFPRWISQFYYEKFSLNVIQSYF